MSDSYCAIKLNNRAFEYQVCQRTQSQSPTVMLMSHSFFILNNSNQTQHLRRQTMKVKLLSLFAGLTTLSLLFAPLSAQACSGADKNTTEDNAPIPTESSVRADETSVTS